METYGPNERRQLAAIALAIVAHGAVFASLRMTAANAPSSFVEERAPPKEDTEVDLVASPPPTPTERSAASEPGARAQEAFARAPTAPTTTAPAEAPPEPPSAPPLAIYAPTPLALGSNNPFLPRAPGAAPGPVSTTTTTFESASPRPLTGTEANKTAASVVINSDSRTIALGMGPQGPILKAFEDAAYTGTAPERGSATFFAKVDASGVVIDLRLLGARPASDAAGWEDARKRAQLALAGVKLTMRGAQGAELKIEVYSDVLLPSGRRPDAPALSPTFKPGDPSRPQADFPSVDQHTVGTFDLADVGAKPRRVVHARVLTLETL